ncbi:hypothetical protein LUZ60_016249 [Juncus effusus]|nr:hypothetical protein LUZ60_016249 [Juncus effusus]
MASNDSDPWEDFQWDAASEAQLQAIEASYSSSSSSSASKRRSSTISDSSSSNHKSKCRRLPNWNLAPSSCRINYRAKHQSIKFGGETIYCKTALEAEKASEELFDKINAKKGFNSHQIALGFDIEWKPTFKRGETTRKAAVMQICMDNLTCYVIHIIHTGIPSLLKSLLQDNSSVKVGVCIANDAWKVLNDYDIKIEPLIDLSNLANIKNVGPAKKWSLSSLTETITCKELLKPNKIRLGNWEAEFLNKEQIKYAATDAFVSWYLYEVLNGMPDPETKKENVEISEIK